MPIYEYTCKDCHTRFEVLRSISKADAPISCVSCEGVNTRRAVSAAFAYTGGHVIAGSSNGGCGGCAGGSCSSCGH